MPKKPTFKESNVFVVLYQDGGRLYQQICVGAAVAVNCYREFRKYYGDAVRLVKVVLDYGEEV